MNYESIKLFSFYGAIVSGSLGIIFLLIPSIMGKGAGEREEEASWVKFLAGLWGVGLSLLIVFLVFLFLMEPKTGGRGAILALMLGFCLPLVLCTVDGRLFFQGEREREKLSLSTYLFSPLFFLGITLFITGVFAYKYGIRAMNLWMSLVLGLSLGAFWVKVASRMLIRSLAAVALSQGVDSMVFLWQALAICLALGSCHFPYPQNGAWLPYLLALAIFLGWVLTLASLLFQKPRENPLVGLPTHLFLLALLFMTFTFFISNRIRSDMAVAYPALVGLLNGIFILGLVRISLATRRDFDPWTGAFAVLLILGSLWAAFKWGFGFGISLCALGTFSIAGILVPYRYYEAAGGVLTSRPPDSSAKIGYVLGPEWAGEEEIARTSESQDTQSDASSSPRGEEDTYKPAAGKNIADLAPWGALLLRGTTLCGLVALLMGACRLFLERADLASMGVDVSDANLAIALSCGVFLPLFLEGAGIFSVPPYPTLPRVGQRSGIIRAFGIFVGTILLALFSIFVVSVLFNIAGLAALLMGTALCALIGCLSLIAYREERGLFTAIFSPVWVGFGCACILIYPLHARMPEMTRSSKIWILAAAILIVLLLHLVGHLRKGESGRTPGAGIGI